MKIKKYHILSISWVFVVISFKIFIFINTFNFFFILAAVDAYEIGRLAYTDGKYDLTVGWMKEALTLAVTNEEQKRNLPSKVDILDHLAWSEYKVRKRDLWPFHAAMKSRNQDYYSHSCKGDLFFLFSLLGEQKHVKVKKRHPVLNLSLNRVCRLYPGKSTFWHQLYHEILSDQGFLSSYNKIKLLSFYTDEGFLYIFFKNLYCIFYLVVIFCIVFF